MVLGHPFDEVVKFLDEVPDLQIKIKPQSNEDTIRSYIITAEVEALGPWKDQGERLSTQRVRTPSCRPEEIQLT